MPKKPKPARKPASLTLEHAEALRQHAQVINRLVAIADALCETVGQEPVRRASARIKSRAALAVLQARVADGKLVETQSVTSPGTCAVEFSEWRGDELLTPSVVAELSQFTPELGKKFVGKAAGGSVEHDGVRITIVRCWDVVK